MARRRPVPGTNPGPHTRPPGGWRPGLVALDIDGTVVDYAGRLPAAVRDAVQRVLAAGTQVVLATGRSWHSTSPIFDQLGLPPGPAVSSNGAVTVTYPPLELTRAVTFDPSDVISKVAEFAPDALIAVEEVGSGYRMSGHFPEGDLTGKMVVESIESLKSTPVTRIIVRDPQSSAAEFLQLAGQLGLHGVTYFIGYSAWLDIAPEGTNKATALADIAAQLDVDPTEVLALGDGRNDIEMLSWAGRGVALGDAPAEVQQVADHVTGLFDDGGTVEELSRWFS